MSSKPSQLKRQLPVWGLYIIGFIPAIWGFYLGATDQMGTDPVKAFEHYLGFWAIRFLLLTLVITPLRELFRINLIRYRRALGLLTFWYVLFHFIVYLTLDQALRMPEIISDITKRPFIIFGMLALILLIPLALTSFNWAIRKLRKNWKRLHGLVYTVAILGMIHMIMGTKVLSAEQMLYVALFVLLLGYRAVVWLKRRTA
ncbi:MAG: protein-methionine-sulfoxide reductase heme-binding subunit MsrQ [Ponticaulis sp.]|nr:protein-methionine-sulfoxide reductase heme-binding subunit MsrQ [Ponticaulis sp.]|tara:strand:- start:369 stop:971 length:603 start_codon:yes stop_codon:yes gene_type:complete